MATYAIPDQAGTTITNVVTVDPAQAKAGWVAVNPGAGPGIGWALVGGVWTAPPVPVTQQNAASITASVQTHLGQVEAWLAANPTGAVLTAGQTAQLARMLVGLGRIVLGLVDTVGQAT